MTIHQCPRCHYDTDKKTDIRNHYNRKKPCQVLFEDVSLEDCLKQLNKPKSRTCKYCEKVYCRKSYLEKHYESCSMRKKFIKHEKELKKRDKEIEELKEKLEENNNPNIINNYTNYNTIVIKFDVNQLSTRIPDEEKLKCFRDKTYQAPPIEDFLKTIHFNPEYPEYHNIFKSDMNREWISIFDGDKVVKQPDTFVDDIIEKIENEIEYLIENNSDYKSYYKGLKTHFNMMKKDEEYKQSLVKGVKLLIHNNKDVPKNTLRLMGVV
jgi:hypothetical protein